VNGCLLHSDHYYTVVRFGDGECTAGACVSQALMPVAPVLLGDDIRGAADRLA
jgi:hypothetical protein